MLKTLFIFTILCFFQTTKGYYYGRISIRSNGWNILTLNSENFDENNRGNENPSETSTPSTKRVFVGNLRFDATQQELTDHMKTTGSIKDINFFKRQDGRPVGSAVIEYSSTEDAIKAIQTLHDSEFLGRKILVREDRELDSMVRKSEERRNRDDGDSRGRDDRFRGGDRFQSDRSRSDRFRENRGREDRFQSDRPRGDRFRDNRGGEDRFQRGDRSREREGDDRPRGDRFGGRGYEDRFQSDRPRGDRFQSDRPRGDRFSSRGGEDRFQSDRPRRDRFGDRGGEDRFQSDRPRGDRFSGRGGEDRSQNDRTRGDRFEDNREEEEEHGVQEETAAPPSESDAIASPKSVRHFPSSDHGENSDPNPDRRASVFQKYRQPSKATPKFRPREDDETDETDISNKESKSEDPRRERFSAERSSFPRRSQSSFNSRSSSRDRSSFSSRQDFNNNPNEINEDIRKILIVENLPAKFAWQDLKDAIKDFGSTVRVDVVSIPPSEENNNKRKNIGIVEFRSREDVASVIEASPTPEQYSSSFLYRLVDSKEEYLSFRQQTPRGKRLHVGNLSPDVTWEQLKDHFKTVGDVVKATVLVKPEEESRSRRPGRKNRRGGEEDEEEEPSSTSYGIVEFRELKDADKALQTLNGSILGNPDFPLMIRKFRE